MRLSRAEWAVALFNAAYILGFLLYFTQIANREFIGYIVTMLVLIALMAAVHAMQRAYARGFIGRQSMRPHA